MIMNSFHEFFSERKRYFEAGQKEISETNLRILVEASFTATFLVCVLVAMTPYIVKGWTPSIWHLLLGPCAAMFFLGSFFYRKKKKKSKWVIQGACMCFIAFIFAFVIGMDVLENTCQASSFMQLLLIVLPCLFVFPFYIIYAEIMLFELVYLALVIRMKPLLVAENDCFNSIVGIMVSVCVAFIIQRLRAESYNLQERYKHLSMTDGLTGMMNKVNCEHAVKQYLSKRGESEGCALLILDVDNFKQVNDTQGHQTGDQVLSKVADVLMQTFRSTDMMGRIGGDEFMVFMRNIPGKERVEKKCAMLLENIEALADKLSFTLSCSVGAAYLEEGPVEYDEFFEAADNIMYEAKTTGKAQVMIRNLRGEAELSAKKPLLLIADDNEMNRDILHATLKDDYEILEAGNGKEALEVIHNYQNDLVMILLDLYMPDADGYQILKVLKTRTITRDIPVIVITADNKSEKDVLLMGAVDMIAKPFDSEIVKLRVKNASRKILQAK